MEVTQGIVLPVLVAAIIANTVILVLVVVAMRGGRGDRMTSTRSAIEGSMLSTSFVDRSASSAWRSNGGSDPEASTADREIEDAPTDEDAGSHYERTPDDAPLDEASDGSGDATVESEADYEGDSDETPSGAGTSGVDALTGLLDHAAFARLIATEDVRVQRYHRPATVVIFELGGLDRLTERLGVEAADRVIPALADTMRRLAREVDFVARLAPGRFGVLLPETDEIAAINYVERVRRACELWLESGAIALNLAAGWAGSTGDPTLIEDQRLATDRMYVELRRDARKVTDL